MTQQFKVQAMWIVRTKLAMKSLRKNWSLFVHSRLGLIGLSLVIFFLLFGLAHPLYVAVRADNEIYDPVTGFAYDLLPTGETNPHPPTWAHPLGTDILGRDVLGQLMYSTAKAFMLGLIAAGVGVFIATLVGSTAAYFGGFVDSLFMRVADVVMLFPVIAFLVALSAAIEITLFKLAIILAVLFGFGGSTIILKSQALSVKVKPFIEAARVSGGGHFRIITAHIIPNVLPLSFLYMMFGVTSAIFSEAALSYLGFLNVRMSLGIMIYTANDAGYLIGSRLATYWYLWLPPGLVISLLCAGFYFVGRGLDEVVNPRLRER